MVSGTHGLRACGRVDAGAAASSFGSESPGGREISVPLRAGRRRFARAVLGGASTLAVVAGMLGALGAAVPAPAARAAAALTAAASSSLSCVYRVTAAWPGGFAVEVTLTNTGTSPVNWSLTWTWTGGQQLTGGWNASFSQSGATITVTGTSYNWVIPPGGSITFGFTATGTAPPVLPIPCTRAA
jgi:cellulase/cellobiase CelA1